MSKAQPARWNIPFTEWEEEDWRNEGMTREEFVAVMRETLNDRVDEMQIDGSKTAHQKLRDVAADAFHGDDEALRAFRLWFDEDDPIWDDFDDTEVADRLREQIDNASREQILTYAWTRER